jgi:hypothetical protein
MNYEAKGIGRSARSAAARWGPAIALTIIICTVSAIRIRLLALPLERDEGEYAYAGQLILQGIPPYRLAYSMKLPGTFAAYALIMLLVGQTTAGIHLGLIIVNSITIVLIYFLGRRLFGRGCGIVAAGAFGLLSLSHSVFGLAAHATHFVTLFAVAGTLVLLRAAENRRRLEIFGAGLLFGLALLMKQNGAFFAVAGGLLVLWREFRTPRSKRSRPLQGVAIYCAGVILPLALTCLVLAVAGVFDRFWFWTVVYAREYGREQSLTDGWWALQYIGSRIIGAAPIMWLLAFAGMLLVWRKKNPEPIAVMVGFSVAAIATVIPGLHFRHHYFIPILPAIGLWMGAGVQTVYGAIIRQANRKIWTGLLLAVLGIAVGDMVSRHRSLFFQLSAVDASRAIYDLNPFPESVEIAHYIAEHTNPDDRIGVIGSEPQIYFYSKRRSATGYLYTYPLIEPHRYAARMQQEMMEEVEAANPKFLVDANVPYALPALVQEWLDRYTSRDFETVGFVTIRTGERGVFHWETNADAVRPDSDVYVTLWKRKGGF